MPKRKNKEGSDNIRRKIKKLEKKIKKYERRCRRESNTSSDRTEAGDSSPHLLEHEDGNLMKTPIGDVENIDITPHGPNETDIAEAGPSTAPDLAIDSIQIMNAEPNEVDTELIEILGADPSVIQTYGKDIQKDLAVRYEHWATNGLSKESRKELKDRYLVPDNCKMIDAPVLNPEMKAAMSDVLIKRDKAIEFKQKQLASAVACLSEATTRLLSSSERDSILLKMLMDAGRLLCDSQHSESITRRNFVISSLKQDIREQLRTIKIDNLLFGQELPEKLKIAKVINKSGSDLKLAPAYKQTPTSLKKSTPRPTKPLNKKGPVPARRQPGPPRTREPAQTNNRRAGSSKQSYHRQNHNHR